MTPVTAQELQRLW